MRRRLHAALLPAAVLALALAGCGGGDDAKTPVAAKPPVTNGVDKLPATEILAKTKAAALAASSVHYTGGMDSDGQSVKFDVRASQVGDGQGDITFAGISFSMLRKGSDVFFKGDDSFYKQFSGAAGEAEAVKMLKGKYLKGSATDAKWSGLSSFTDSDDFLRSMFEEDDKTAKYSVGEKKDVGGVAAVSIVQSGKNPGVMWVSLVGEPLPLRIEGGTGKDEGSLTFTDWNKPIEVTVPAEAEVIDPKNLPKP